MPQLKPIKTIQHTNDFSSIHCIGTSERTPSLLNEYNEAVEKLSGINAVLTQ